MRFLDHPLMKFLSPMLAALLVAGALYFFGLPGSIKDVQFAASQAATSAAAAHTRLDKLSDRLDKSFDKIDAKLDRIEGYVIQHIQ